MTSAVSVPTGHRLACRFCELASGTTARSTRDQWVAATKNFVAFPSVGPLIDGWVLVVPRRHVLNLGTLTSDLHAELNDLIMELSAVLESEYSTAISRFEHGSSLPMQPAGCSVDHAHLHLVGLDFDLIAEARRQYPQFEVRDHDGGLVAAANVAAGRSYIYMRNVAGEEGIIVGAEDESQLLRRVIATSVGDPDRWNWREHPQADRAAQCAAQLISRGRLIGAGNQ